MSLPLHVFTREQSAALRTLLLTKPENERWSLICESLFPPLALEGLVEHIVSGCVCCVGHLALQVTLGRVLRHEKPQRIVLYLSHDQHLDRLKAQLNTGSFGAYLHVVQPD
jgi:hypothetical protein